MSSVVPEGWELSPLSALADYKNGRAFKPSDWSKSGLPILRIAQINNPHKVDDYYDGNDIDDGHFITKGDLIFSWSATLKAEIWSHYDAVLNQHIFKVTEKVGTNRIYLQQLLDYAIPKLAESSHGSTMKHIKKGVLDEFFSPIPPLPEQKKIASILTSVDEVIENTQKQINKLQDLKKATMNELLTKGIGHTEFKDSELGRIPKSWEVAQIGDVTSFSQGIQVDVEQHHETKDDSKVRFVRISDYTKLDETPRYIDSALALKGLVEKDDVVMIRYGEAGRVCRGIVGAIANNLFTIRPSPRLLKDYLYYYCASEEIRSKVEALSASSAMPAVSFSSLRTLKLKIPPVDEQDLIVSAISSLDRSIEIHSQKLSQTQSLKKSLMQDLLTGKVRVTVN